jgi:hypothetical protein
MEYRKKAWVSVLLTVYCSTDYLFAYLYFSFETRR